MDIKEIREQWAILLVSQRTAIPVSGDEWAEYTPDVQEHWREKATQILNTEIVPERVCKRCGGAGRLGRTIICYECDGARFEPPITVEQAIKKAQHDKVMK